MRKLLLISLIALTILAVVIARFRPSLRGVFDEAIQDLDRFASLAMTLVKFGNKPQKILILLGNDNEIRTNLGFPGSYATFTANFKFQISNFKFDNLAFHDIYTPTGQIQGHVEPPKPIQDAFQQGEWLLPNFDFSPDFPTSAKSFRWFMEKAGAEKFDILMTLNLSTVKKIIKVIGYDDEKIANDLQTKAELNFFPGSTQKKDALEQIGKEVFNKIKEASLKQKFSIAKIILEDLDSGNILLNASDDSLQNLFNKSNWSGSFPISNIKYPISKDFFMMIENNYGANKANCCVSRKTTHVISALPPLQGGTQRGINHRIFVSFSNSSPLENPDPPRFYGGNYLSYIRIYIPDSATNIKVTDHSNEVPPNTRYPSLGSLYPSDLCSLNSAHCLSLFHLTRANSSSSIEISYDLPLPLEFTPQTAGKGETERGSNYSLTIYKQNGLPPSPQEINLFGKTFSTNLERSQNFSSVIPSETK